MSSETPPNPNSDIRRSARNKSQVLSGYGESKKKQALWSEDDDIALLKGMVDYHLQKGSDPYDDRGKFLEYIKPFIHFDVVRKQLNDRLWALKNKYVVRCKFDANNPHEAKLYELSKMIIAWGDGYVSEEILDDGRIEKSVKDKRGKVDDVDDGPLLKDDSGVVDDVNIAKKKRKVVISDDGRCVDDERTVVLALGDVNAAVKKSKNKGKVVINDDGQNVEGNVGGGKKKGNIVISDDARNGKDDSVVVNNVNGVKKKGKKRGNVVTGDNGRNAEEESVHVNDVNRAQKKKKKRGDVVISDDGQNVVEDVNSAKTKGKNVGNGNDGQNVNKDDVVADDVNSAKKKVKKRVKVVTSDVGRNVKEDSVLVDDVNTTQKKDKKRRNTVIGDDSQCVVVGEDANSAKKKDKKVGNFDDGISGKNDIVVVHDASGAKKKGNVVTSDDGVNVKEDSLLVDDVNRALKKGKKKGNVVISDDGRNVLEDVDSAKKKDKKVGNVVDGENVKMDDVVVYDDGNAKKKGEKRVKFVGSGSVTPKTVKENLKDDKVDGQNVNEDVDDVVKNITSIYPHLSKSLEKHVPMDHVMPMISSIGKEKANELEEGWSEIRIMEVELRAEKLGMMNKQIQLILEAMPKLKKT